MQGNLGIFSVGGTTAGKTGTAIFPRVSQGQQGVLQTQVCLSGSEQKNRHCYRELFFCGFKSILTSVGEDTNR